MPGSLRTLLAVASTTLFCGGCTLLFGLDGIADRGAPVDAATCDGNFVGDPHNCGRCGHDCLGGQCVASRCQPLAIATGANSPLHIAVDGAAVYWLNYGPSDDADAAVPRENSLERVGKDGSDRRMLYSTTSWRYPYGFAQNATHVFWASESGALVRVDKQTGAFILPAQDPVGPHGVDVDVDAGLLYWVNDNGAVTSVTVEGAGQQLLATASGHYSLAIDDAYVFVGGYQAGPGVRRIPRAGCPDASACGTTISKKDVLSMVVGADGVYAVTASSGIVEIPKDGGPDTPVTGDTSAGSVAVDRDWIYWVTYTSTGSVFRKRKDSALVETLAEGQSFPDGIAVDDVAVYWANRGTESPPYGHDVFERSDGTIMKVAK